MSKVYVFRIEYAYPERNKYIREELSKGKLRQGWGGSDSNLFGVNEEEWIKCKCEKEIFDGNKEYYKRKYKNLKNMLEIEKDDIVIIPKTPSYDMFTICRASGKYEFLDSVGYGGDDYQHTIPIDVKSIREFNYHANEYCEIIRAKMRAYHLP